MTVAQVEMPAKLAPVFLGEADVRGSWGGRGSGKTRSFAKMTAVRAYAWSKAGRTGTILCGRQYMNSLAESSMEEIKTAIAETDWLAPHFDIGEKYIRTADGRVSYAFSGLDRNIDSIKSKSRILLGWVDEAEPVTEEAWQKLIPTLREEDSELWVTWNPESKRSPTHKRFRETDDPRFKLVELNWRDNPWFPQILERQRLRDQAERPDSYDHIWEGDFASVYQGAYYASALAQARRDGRIGNVAADPLMPRRAFFDIGFADSTSIWIAQFVGTELRFIDYYEASGQPLATHLDWLRANGHGSAEIVLPHDGSHGNAVTGTRFEDHVRAAGFQTRVIPNQGRGAAMRRVEASRRLFPACRFDAGKCDSGLESLAAYHERQDETRGIGLGPEHDWSSHGADAFGMACLTFEMLREQVREPVVRHREHVGAHGAWMGGPR
jgi:phage terminase large subunit